MSGLKGWRVAALESRRGAELERLLSRQGAEPHVVAALREAPVADPRPIIDFSHQLLVGQIDVVVFLTGVGCRALLETAAGHVDREKLLNALRDIPTIARGPKPTAALRDAGIEPTYRTEPPDTWREILTLVDTHLPVANATVAIQEYGQPNTSLIAGLEARGATVVPVPVYRYALPEDTGPLEQLVRDLTEGRYDAILFTAAQQAVHLRQIAERVGCVDVLKNADRQLLVASIGPSTTAAVETQLDWPVDFEPDPPKMGHLVSRLAEAAEELRRRKRRVQSRLEATSRLRPDPAAPWYDSPFLKACRGEPTPYTPVWLMRQAGRYMAEYQAVRAKVSFLELCRNPQLASEVMCTAVAKLNVDAAIIFSDLLPILEPMGLELEFEPGGGPVIHNPVREGGDVDRVRELETVEALDYVMQVVRQTRSDLPDTIPLIGFAGAPFTLASYLIEGGSSRHYLHTKTLMYRDRGAWDALMQRLARSVTRYLNGQIAAGAQCVQLFDSWVGCLSPHDYRRYVLPYVRQIVQAIVADVPLIYFGTGNPALIPAMAEAGSRVVGVDWRIDLGDAWRRVGWDRSIQGNLDPAVLLADRSTIVAAVSEVLRQAENRPGHIFNLGHGVLPQTPVEHAQEVVRAVHELSARA